MSWTYVLDGKTPVLELNLFKWSQWFGTADRRVALTHVDDIEVSTVFLGLDHNYGLEGPPLLFETMVFGGELDQECRRYATWQEAEDGHAYVVKLVQLSEGY